MYPYMQQQMPMPAHQPQPMQIPISYQAFNIPNDVAANYVRNQLYMHKAQLEYHKSMVESLEAQLKTLDGLCSPARKVK